MNRRLAAACLALASVYLLLPGRMGRAAEADAPAKYVVRSAGDFWNPPPVGRDKAQPVDLSLVVLFYDPTWKLLWAQAPDTAAWFNTAGAPLPIASGQHVHLRGTFVPDTGLSGDTLHAEVLAENAWPAPIHADVAWDNPDSLEGRWVIADGYVCGDRVVDETHRCFDVLCHGRLVTAYLQHQRQERVPSLVGKLVRVRFVYVTRRAPGGKVMAITAWVPRVDDFDVLGALRDDPRFVLPLTPIANVGAARAGQPVRISGVLHAQDPGHWIALRDASGQVLIATEQPLRAEAGDRVEVIGRSAGRSLSVTLADPICRATPVPSGATPVANSDEELRLADEVMQLRPEEAARQLRVMLHAVVTWSNSGADFFFVRDVSGGVRVRAGTQQPVPAIGATITFEGVTVPGAFAPEVQMKRLNMSVPDEPPPANRVLLQEALTGTHEAEQVQMRGYLRAAEPAGRWTQLDLTTATGEFTALVPADPTTKPPVGAVVRVTGVCTAVVNDERELTGVRLWVAGMDAVAVEQPRPADPFGVPERSIANLHQFVGARMLDRPVRVRGSVLVNRPGRFMYLQDGDAAVLVLHRDSLPLAPGEWVEAVGLPGHDGSRLVVREAEWRRTARGAAPRPVRLNDAAVLNRALDGRLVTVRAQVQDRMNEEGNARLLLRAGRARFEARLENTLAGTLPSGGSVLDVTGVYVLTLDEYRQARTFTLLVRTPADIRVVQPAPWWTTGRAIAVIGGLMLCGVVATGWIVVLRRRVRQQTEQIRQQLAKEAQLSVEVERAARLESLGVLAGGIAHDFNNLLTVIMANIGLAAMDDRVQAAAGPILADAERGARRAAELTQQLLTFAKGGDPVRRAVALPEVVREAADFALHGSHVRCDYEVEPDLPPADVDRGQISRVVHNLVLNAIQAMPEGGAIRIALKAVTVGCEDGEPKLKPGRYVQLAVRDTGRGIEPHHLQRIFEPYFSTKPKNNGLGLATVHSIIKKHHGHICAASVPGQGTTFTVWLPVADAPIEAVRSPGSARSTEPVNQTRRILFMDDEEAIRLAAESVLRQLGFETTIVADGWQAVQAYETALRAGQPFDAVILDLTVPGGIGGRAAMELLRNLDPGVRAIVSSGYSNDPVLANYRDYGFAAVVPKPYHIGELARAIEDVLGQPAVARA